MSFEYFKVVAEWNFSASGPPYHRLSIRIFSPDPNCLVQAGSCVNVVGAIQLGHGNKPCSHFDSFIGVTCFSFRVSCLQLVAWMWMHDKYHLLNTWRKQQHLAWTCSRIFYKYSWYYILHGIRDTGLYLKSLYILKKKGNGVPLDFSIDYRWREGATLLWWTSPVIARVLAPLLNYSLCTSKLNKVAAAHIVE